MKTKRWKYSLYIVLAFFPFINVLGSNNISIPLYTVKSGDIHVDGALVQDPTGSSPIYAY